MKTQNHTGFGQFQTGLTDPQPPKSENHTNFGQFCTTSQPPVRRSLGEGGSTLDAQRLWRRQPDEPAADYQLFADWLRLPAPRRFTRCAASLGSSVCRLRRLSARHRWKSRAAAFDDDRADASSRALEQLLHQEDLQTRASHFRQQEWELHEGMLQAAAAAARHLHEHPRLCSLSSIAKVLDLASVLGRRSLGLPLNPADQPVPPKIDPAIEEALLRAYGPKQTDETPESERPHSEIPVE